MFKKKFSDEDLIQLKNEGLTYTQMAEKLGATYAGVQKRAVKLFGLKDQSKQMAAVRERRKKSEPYKPEIISYKLSMEEIEKRYGAAGRFAEKLPSPYTNYMGVVNEQDEIN